MEQPNPTQPTLAHIVCFVSFHTAFNLRCGISQSTPLEPGYIICNNSSPLLTNIVCFGPLIVVINFMILKCIC